MKTESLTLDHLSRIRECFDALRKERRSEYADYLADPAILDFHFDRLSQQLQQLRNDDQPSNLFAFMKDEQILGLAGIAPSPLHSECYGVPIYKIQPFYCFTKDKEELRFIAKALWYKCQNPQVAAYLGRIEAANPHLAYVLGEAGFVPSGSSVRLIYDPSRNNPTGEKKHVDETHAGSYDRVVIRMIDPADVPALQEIGKASHKHSHFFAELRFPRERTQDLFSRWLRRCAEGIADTVLVAEADNKPVGFSTILVNAHLQPYIHKTIGIIDFIAVDPSAQGQGVGARLLYAAFDRLSGIADRIELRTMLDNIHAIRFYERRGFTFLASDHHFHYWSGPPEYIL